MTFRNRHELERGALRAIRIRSRQGFRKPRLTVLPEIKTRVGLWKARVEAAQKAGRISKGCHLYLFNLLTVSSVVSGHYCLYSDPSMGERINLSGRTIRRHRYEAVHAGLVQSLDGRERHQTCMVRPMLPDGAVFELPKKPDNPDTSGRPGRPILADDLLLRASSKTPPTPQTAQDNRPVKEIGRPLVAADVVPDGPPRSPPPPPEGKGLSNEGVAAPPELITFAYFWSAISDQVGKSSQSAAAIAWRKLSPTDVAAIAEALRAGRVRIGSSLVANWLSNRLWPTLAVPTTAAGVAAQIASLGVVRVKVDSPAGRAWRDYWIARGEQVPAKSNRDDCFIRSLQSEWPPKT